MTSTGDPPVKLSATRGGLGVTVTPAMRRVLSLVWLLARAIGCGTERTVLSFSPGLYAKKVND